MIGRSRSSVGRKAFSVQSSHTFAIRSAVFGEQNLVSAAGLVPVLELAEQTGSFAVDRRACRPAQQPGGVGRGEPGREADHDVAGMMCGADSIDDVNAAARPAAPRGCSARYTRLRR